jgi:heme exporter protein A
MNDAGNQKKSPAIRIHDLTKRFGFRDALDGIGLDLEHGGLLAVFGPNGAGKTTLIRILATLMRPTSGEVSLFGRDLETEGETLRKAIGVLTHHPLLFENLTGYENLRFYGQMFEVSELNRRIEELLSHVGLDDSRDQLVGTYSRGMQQRLAIARALIHEPRLLLLDEPYTGLDQNGIGVLRRTLRTFLDGGKTAVMTCHDFDRGLEFSTKAAILNSGHLIYYGDPSKLDESFESLYHKNIV